MDVGNGSCWGDKACQGLSGVEVKDGSCIGTRACDDLGDDTTIDDGSCIGERACEDLGSGAEFTVGKGACIGDGICDCDDPLSDGNMEIPDGECVEANGDTCCL